MTQKKPASWSLKVTDILIIILVWSLILVGVVSARSCGLT